MSPIADPIWHLDWLTFDPDATDPAGVTWILTDQVGFWDGPSPRSDSSLIVEKVNRHGAMMGPNWMQERIITLKGVTFAPDQGTLSYAVTQFSSICSDPNKTYQLSCDSQLGQIYANVRLDGQVHISPFALNPSFTWSIQLIATDPRKYTRQQFSALIGLPQTSTGDGLDFSYAQNQVTNPQFTTDTSTWTAESLTTLTSGIVPSNNNLLSNPGFESGTTSWTPTGGTLAQSTTQKHSGTYSGKITPDGVTVIPYVSSTMVPVTAGTSYMASAWLWFTSAETNNSQLIISYYTAGGAYISQTTHFMSASAATWTQNTNSSTAPATATQANVSVTYGGTPPASQVFYVDDVVLTPIPSAGVVNAAVATSTGAGTNGLKTALATVNNQNYYITGSGYVYATTSKTVTVYIGWYDASNALVSETTQAQALTANTWTRVSASGSMPGNATQYRIGARETAGASGSVFYASAFQAEYGLLTDYTSTLSGLNYGNFNITNVGLTFGASNTSGFSNLQNNGTAPAMPVYTLYGPLTTPVLTATTASGATSTMKYNATLGIGDSVVIDPNAPSVIFNGASRRYLLNPANFSGFAIPAIDGFTGNPGSLQVGLSHSGASNAGGYCTATYQWAIF